MVVAEKMERALWDFHNMLRLNGVKFDHDEVAAVTHFQNGDEMSDALVYSLWDSPDPQGALAEFMNVFFKVGD